MPQQQTSWCSESEVCEVVCEVVCEATEERVEMAVVVEVTWSKGETRCEAVGA
jgi:hypothetical protein